MKKVIIAGPRDWDDCKMVFEYCDRLLGHLNDLTVISGCGGTTDANGENWAYQTGRALDLYPANWTEYGKSAGPRRNRKMIVVGRAEGLLAFWDYKSKGTSDMIRKAKTAGLNGWVVNIDTKEIKLLKDVTPLER